MRMVLMLKMTKLQRLKDTAENAKKSYLLNQTKLTYHLSLWEVQDLFHLVKSLTRAKFESMTEHLINETLDHIKIALKKMLD